MHSFRRRLPFQFHNSYRFEVKDFKTDMISNELWFKRQTRPFHVSFGVLFFCNHIHPRPSKGSYRTRKKGKNKQTQGSAHLPKSAASLSNKISAKIFKMAPVTINDPNGTSWTVPIFRRNWQKWNWKEIDLLNNRVTSLRSFTGIRFVENDDCFRSTGIWTWTDRTLGIYLLPPVQNVKVSIYWSFTASLCFWSCLLENSMFLMFSYLLKI